METRYIDANKLQESFEKIADEPDCMHEGENWQTGIYLAGTITDKQPTADVEEVRYGEWIKCQKLYGIGYEYVCSACEKGIRQYEGQPICSECGAKMDRGKLK